ncbi:HNH endonuclease [Burkholderia multivorans]|uniref:HNH endonuclease n=1 Tax=Burkholderia multivorans TaxID=87883 RepID=A0AAP2HQ42_9BURK|nr:HNH endonuclease [Burkholderia multivorans]MBU9360066.1 HNH endonuclease [Burkholderia multivorans]MBU9496250.1 HNH endonuclease [Burkholderia multivorans]
MVEIDVDDLESVSGFPWRIDAKGYVIRSVSWTKIQHLHRLITNAPDGYVVDHINGNKLDNRRENLRVCTVAQNLRNRRRAKSNKSGLKGVYLDKTRWRAQIRIDGRKICLGSFPTADLAHEAYKFAAREYHGEFARFE